MSELAASDPEAEEGSKSDLIPPSDMGFGASKFPRLSSANDGSPQQTAETILDASPVQGLDHRYRRFKMRTRMKWDPDDGPSPSINPESASASLSVSRTTRPPTQVTTWFYYNNKLHECDTTKTSRWDMDVSHLSPSARPWCSNGRFLVTKGNVLTSDVFNIHAVALIKDFMDGCGFEEPYFVDSCFEKQSTFETKNGKKNDGTIRWRVRYKIEQWWIVRPSDAPRSPVPSQLEGFEILKEYVTFTEGGWGRKDFTVRSTSWVIQQPSTDPEPPSPDEE